MVKIERFRLRKNSCHFAGKQLLYNEYVFIVRNLSVIITKMLKIVNNQHTILSRIAIMHNFEQ